MFSARQREPVLFFTKPSNDVAVWHGHFQRTNLLNKWKDTVIPRDLGERVFSDMVPESQNYYTVNLFMET